MGARGMPVRREDPGEPRLCKAWLPGKQVCVRPSALCGDQLLFLGIAADVLGPLVQELRQLRARGPIKPPVLIERQRAGELENIVVLPARAAMRRATPLAWRMQMEPMTVGAQHSPHASKSEAAHPAAVGQRPRRYAVPLRRIAVDHGLAQPVCATRPYAGQLHAPGWCGTRLQLPPDLRRTTLDGQCHPKPRNAELKEDWPEQTRTALTLRCVESLRGKAPRRLSVHCKPCLSPHTPAAKVG